MSLRFTYLDRRSIRRLKPGERMTEHGITVERHENGDLRYSVNVMVDGQRIHRAIGRESEGVTRTQCEDFIEATRTEAREGRLSLPTGRKAHLTFERAGKNYLDRLEETDGKNLKAKKRHLELYLSPFFGNLRLNAISSFAIDRYKKQRQEAGASTGTINRELATLSHIFNKGTEWGWVKTPPCRLKMFPESRGRIIALNDDEEEALFQASIQDEDPDCWLFVAFGLNTAMRHSEILRSRFDQLNIDHLRLLIPQAKAGMREQPITQELADILQKECEMRECEDQGGWIFPTPRPNASGTGHRHRMDKPFRRAVIKAGLDPETVTPHVMRHTAITKLVKAGVDLPTIQRISGHKTVEMVLRYTHVHGSHIDQAIRNIGRGLPEHAENPDNANQPKNGTSNEQNP